MRDIPRTARWLQRDPIDASSGDPNLYRYAGNDPVNAGDNGGTQGAPKQAAGKDQAGHQAKRSLGKIPPQEPVQPRDPRFPKPASYPSPVATPYGGFADPNLYIAVWIAAHAPTIMRTISEAYAIMGKYFPAGTLGIQGGPADAFRHCVWACLVQRKLGDFGYQHVVVDHENPTAYWAEGRWNETYSPMDLANNEVGRKCAAQKGKSCEQACLDALKRGELYVLPKKHWQ